MSFRSGSVRSGAPGSGWSLVAGALLLAGCGGAQLPQAPAPSAPDRAAEQPPEASAPPGPDLASGVPDLASGVEVFTPPPVGTVWTYTKDGAPETFERLADMTVEGRPALSYRSTDASATLVNHFVPETGSWLVSTAPDGTPVAGASPQNYALIWPMEVGDSWTASFTLNDYGAAASQPVFVSWTVEGIETWELPSGPVQVFRLVGRSPGVVRTNLFSPALGVYALQETERDGEVTFRRALVEYRPPA